MLSWAKGLFSSQLEPENLEEDPISDQADKITQESETTLSLLSRDLVMDNSREPASDQLAGVDDHAGTSTKKHKKDKKKNRNTSMGGSASVLQREYQIAGIQEGPEDVGASERNPATSPTPASELSAKKEKRRRQKSNQNAHTEDAGGQEASPEAYPSGQVDQPELRTEELTELGNIQQPKSKQKRKHRKSHQEESQISYEDYVPNEPVDAAQLEDTEHQEPEDEITTTDSALKKKNRRKNHKSSTSHSAPPGEEETLQQIETEVEADWAHANEKSKKKKKTKLEKTVASGVAQGAKEARDKNQFPPSFNEVPLEDALKNHFGDESDLSKSNTGKRDQTREIIKETGSQVQGTKNHASDKPIPTKSKPKKSVAKPKTPKVNRTEAGDANSAALLNQFISAGKNRRVEPESAVPSAKALGKRPAVDEQAEHQSKKRKQIDSDSRNGDIRSMFSDDAQNGGSIVTASKTKPKIRQLASNVDVAISSPAVRTSRSGNEEMAGWTASDRRSASAGNAQDSSDDNSVYEEQSVDASTTRRKRYLPVDEPSLLAMETPKSGKKPKQNRATSDKPSNKKSVKAKKDPSSGAKPKRSRSQSVTRPRDGNGRLNDDETRRIADAVELYRVDNDLEQHALNTIIQNNALNDGKKFWDFMTEEVPDVAKRNLQSWCRRNFHNYAARGVWTAEQDEELMELFKTMPKKWSLIGAQLNRLPDDCRDRWRNYLSVTNLELGPWKLEEEHQLKDAVKKCIDLVREDKRREGLLTPEEENDDTYHEHDISWMKVSELMDLSRSHLQCYRKWKSIKNREHATTDDLVAERIVISNSWKNLKSYQEATKTLAGEKLQFLKAIRDSKAGAESKIDWRAIDEKLDRNHDAMEMRICLRGLVHNITTHANKTLQENVQLLIEAYEQSAPHEPEGYVDLPFESTGLKKRTRKSKTSALFENNPDLYDVGGSGSKAKMRHRMLKTDESQGGHNSAGNQESEQSSDSVQVPDSAKKSKRAAPVKKPTKSFALSTERVVDSDVENDNDDGVPTSAQKPRSEDETDDEDVPKPRSKTKQATHKKKTQVTVKTKIVEESSDDEPERQPESYSNSDSEDAEMADAHYDLNDKYPSNETSQSTQFHLGSSDFYGNKKNKHSISREPEDITVDDSVHNHAPVDSDEDFEMQDPDELQVPATPEHELQEGYSELREESADLDESGQIYQNGLGDAESDAESIMDDMSDIPAKVIKKRAPGINDEGGVYFGKESSVDLDQ
ncbi:DNA-binding protein REB1 [Botrytis cinerea]